MSFPVGVALRDLAGFAPKLTRASASLSHFHILSSSTSPLLFSTSPPPFIRTCVIKKYLRPGAEWAILVISVAGEEGEKKRRG